MANAALALVYGKELTPHVEKPIVKLEAAAIERVVGTYALTQASKDEATKKGVPANLLETLETVTVSAGGASIEVKPKTQGPIPFDAESATVFTFEQAGIRIEFTFGPDGKADKATTMTVKQGPLVMVLERK